MSKVPLRLDVRGRVLFTCASERAKDYRLSRDESTLERQMNGGNRWAFGRITTDEKRTLRYVCRAKRTGFKGPAGWNAWENRASAFPQDQMPRVCGAFRSIVDALRGLSLLIDCSLRNLRQGLISRFFLLESFLQKRDSIVQTQLFSPGDQRSVA